MNIVLLGSGNVATHLAAALQASGMKLLQIYSPNSEHANLLADQVDAEPVSALSDVKSDADLYIIAVKDDAIVDVAKQLQHVNGLVVHTSGTTSIDVLTPFVKRAGVFYPLQTFSKHKKLSFAHLPLCIEAKEENDLTILLALAKKISDRVYELDGKKRKVLHVAAVFACNFSNHLYSLAANFLELNELDFDMIRPLISETADKVMTNLPIDVQTGPAVRGDETTVNKHLSMLNNLPELKEIYQTLSNSIKITHK